MCLYLVPLKANDAHTFVPAEFVGWAFSNPLHPAKQGALRVPSGAIYWHCSSLTAAPGEEL